MKCILISAFFGLLYCISACRHDAHDFVTVRWDGGSRIEDIDWKVNGRSCGRGVDGFRNVLVQIKRLKTDGFLRVQYPMQRWNETTQGYDPDDPFPFIGHNDLRREFYDVWGVKKLTLQKEAF